MCSCPTRPGHVQGNTAAGQVPCSALCCPCMHGGVSRAGCAAGSARPCLTMPWFQSCAPHSSSRACRSPAASRCQAPELASGLAAARPWRPSVPAGGADVVPPGMRPPGAPDIPGAPGFLGGGGLPGVGGGGMHVGPELCYPACAACCVVPVPIFIFRPVKACAADLEALRSMSCPDMHAPCRRVRSHAWACKSVERAFVALCRTDDTGEHCAHRRPLQAP